MEAPMFEQVFDNFRKASESSLQMQQDMFRTWAQQWLSAPANTAGATADFTRGPQRRGVELAIEILNKQRETFDALARSGIQIIEQALRTSEAKSPDEYRRIAEDIWRKLFDTYKEQSENQLRDLQSWAEKSFEMSQKA
jgi:hypothetical protein